MALLLTTNPFLKRNSTASALICGTAYCWCSFSGYKLQDSFPGCLLCLPLWGLLAQYTELWTVCIFRNTASPGTWSLKLDAGVLDKLSLTILLNNVTFIFSISLSLVLKLHSNQNTFADFSYHFKLYSLKFFLETLLGTLYI